MMAVSVVSMAGFVSEHAEAHKTEMVDPFETIGDWGPYRITFIILAS